MNLRSMSDGKLLAFTRKLSTRDWRKLIEADFAAIGLFVASDGCTGVPDFYLNCCILHDFYYRTHRNLDATKITKRQADTVLKECIRADSWLGAASPVAWWRFWAVKRFGRKAWM